MTCTNVLCCNIVVLVLVASKKSFYYGTSFLESNFIFLLIFFCVSRRQTKVLLSFYSISTSTEYLNTGCVVVFVANQCEYKKVSDIG